MLMKFTFYLFAIELVAYKALEDLPNMVHMGFQRGGINQDVIYVSDHISSQPISKHIINTTLEDGGGTRESIYHHQVFIVACGGAECCLPIVPLSDANQVVGAAAVEFGEDMRRSKLLMSLWEKIQGISVLNCYLVQSPVINAGSKSAPFLFYKEKKLTKAVVVEGQMYPCWSASSMYSSMACCLASERGYTLQ